LIQQKEEELKEHQENQVKEDLKYAQNVAQLDMS
jgi:hypothetical protein